MTALGPIFVTGLDRSGTNLMYALLASHPNISMARRTNMWRYFYGRYGDLSQPDNFERCFHTMLRYKRITHLNPDPERIRREFWQAEPSYGRLFALFHEHQAERSGKSRWGDKSLRSEHYANEIFKEFPGAGIIHIIRDPRDRYASVFKRYEVNRGKVGVNTERWLCSARLAKLNESRYRDHYLVLKYESLVLQTEATLRKVCEFLGEAYTPAMLTMEGAPDHRDLGGNSSFGKFEPGVISKNPVGRFKKVLTKNDIAFIQIFARRYLSYFDYQPEPLYFSSGERLYFSLIHTPINLVRMVGWRTLDAFNLRIGVTVPSYHLVNDETNREAIEPLLLQTEALSDDRD